MKLLTTALEPSSNQHLQSLLLHLDDVELIGVFDPDLPGTPISTPADFSVMGFIDVLQKIRFFINIRKQLIDLAAQADQVLLMDSSSFNIALAKRIKQRYPDLKITYYILPQVWAWKPWRAKAVERWCDQLASIIPFESRYYPKATYVGHPLLDSITEFRTEPSRNNVIAFLPGSRRSEIKSLMPLFQEAATRLKDTTCLLSIPAHFDESEWDSLYGNREHFVIQRDVREILYQADFAFICSGTATLEAALIGTPFTLAYRAKPVDYWIAKTLVGLKRIGLANIFLDRLGESLMHPELIQNDLSIENLLSSYHDYDYSNFFHKSKQLREYLHHGSAKNAAALLSRLSH